MKAISINTYEIENDDGETMVFMTPKEFDFIKKQNDLKDREIKRLKEEYIMLQNASDKVEEEKDKEIERLNNIIKKVLFILEHMKDDRVGYEVCIDLLKGSDKE